MNELLLDYEATKKNAQLFMKNGQITAYINALLKMNKQKQLLKWVVAN